MPGRKIPLATGEIYHVLNRGVASQPIFRSKRDYQRAQETIFFYQIKQLPLSFSRFLSLSSARRQEMLRERRKKKDFWVEIIAYCLMPNHFHFLLKQVDKSGISIFMSQFSNSYTRFFNLNRNRTGPLLQGKFKAIRIETEEQLNHISRYIHLNPYSSYVVKTLKQTITYPFSSLSEYLNPQLTSLCQKEIIMNNFKTTSQYEKFVLNRADYQRRLEEIKHLALEK